MRELKEIVFIGEIVLQSKIALRAGERLQSESSSSDQVEVWSSIQSILVAAGNVSKILWPDRLYKARGERLRQLLNVEMNNLLSNRDFRNHFEHYDERIEKWFSNNSSTVYKDLSINPNLRGAMAGNDHRGYNSHNNTLIFRDELLDLNEILKAIEEILNSCKPFTLA